jgi:hypothetical protein
MVVNEKYVETLTYILFMRNTLMCRNMCVCVCDNIKLYVEIIWQDIMDTKILPKRPKCKKNTNAFCEEKRI